MTEPFVLPEVDLRDFAYMPLDVVRLRDSDLAASSSAEEFRCAVLLWCASWHQVPAASLPDDDIILASLAGFGRAVRDWRKVREGALRKWIKCSDGRLYHPTVAEKANEAWAIKQRQRQRTAAARAARQSQSPRFDTTEHVTESVTDNVTAPVTENVTASKGVEGKGVEGKIEESSSLRSDDSASGKPTLRKRNPSKAIPQELPEEWHPDEGDYAYAESNGLSLDLLKNSLESMRLWAKANGTRKHDWHATLKGFMRRDAQAHQPRASPQGVNGRQLSTSEGFGMIAAEIRRRKSEQRERQDPISGSEKTGLEPSGCEGRGDLGSDGDGSGARH